MSIETGKENKIDQLISYQEGSVVSRTLVDKKSGTVTIFSFASNQGLSDHKTPFEALIEVVDGEFEVTIDGKKHQLEKGQIILMPANKTHSVKAKMNSKMILTMIREI